VKLRLSVGPLGACLFDCDAQLWIQCHFTTLRGRDRLPNGIVRLTSNFSMLGAAPL
jgi:hypothetical protein